MNLRTIPYFATLARERHFARAAEICGITQPTLSAALGALEEELGKRLIERDRRYIGLTPEGEAMLPWAQQILAAHDSMLQSVHGASGNLQGTLRLGAIPAALPAVGQISRHFLRLSPELNITVRSLTSDEIVNALNAFELDAGITYLDPHATSDKISEKLFTDHHILVMPKALAYSQEPVRSWAAAAKLPLCLLHSGMQNRRIIDAVFSHHGLSICPRATADSFVALLAMVRAGEFATILPESHQFMIEGMEWAEIAALDRQSAGSDIGMIVADRFPLNPLSSAALGAARAYRQDKF